MLAGAAITPLSWSVDPALLLTVAVGALYVVGARRTVTPERTRKDQRVRSAYFYSALAVIVLALNSPLDKLSEQLFWAHMIQHVLLIAVAPPLLVLARPWARLWRALSLDSRRTLARNFAGRATGVRVRHAARAFAQPVPSFIAFSVVLLAWHVPSLFDSTLRSTPVHVLEHGA